MVFKAIEVLAYGVDGATIHRLVFDYSSNFCII